MTPNNSHFLTEFFLKMELEKYVSSEQFDSREPRQITHSTHSSRPPFIYSGRAPFIIQVGRNQNEQGRTPTTFKIHPRSSLTTTKTRRYSHFPLQIVTIPIRRTVYNSSISIETPDFLIFCTHKIQFFSILEKMAFVSFLWALKNYT